LRGVRVFVLSSGSTGNVAVVEADGARVMIDAGLNPTAAATRMRTLGVDLFPRAVDALVVTHHHGDHFAHAEGLARATKAPVYLHDGVHAPRLRARFPVVRYAAYAPFRVGPFEILACPLPHDAPHVALRIAAGRCAVTFATDVGHVTRPLLDLVCDSDAAIVEANYCPELLAVGPYPPRLKGRVAGPLGHLSNHQTADLAARAVRTRLRALHLGHLSQRNNAPDRALDAVAVRVGGALEVDVLPHGGPRLIDVTPSSRVHVVQLSLGIG
jgi:phosphoribosyl 1,2-cyclic phosphodiesterase